MYGHISTDALIDELKGRYDTFVFCGTRFDVAAGEPAIDTDIWGDYYKCLGLSVKLSDNLKTVGPDLEDADLGD